MKYSKKLQYTMLVFLSLINIVLRYPTTAHESGTSDTYFVHGLANSISENGYANWIVHPLSIFGSYPYSYPSAGPYLLSGISQSMGLGMESAIFLLAIVIGLFGMFGAYLMAKEIKNDAVFAFLVAFAFSTAPIFLSFTRWMTYTRPLFLLILLFLFFSLLRYHNRKDKRYMFLSIVLLVTLASIHRMVWLAIPLLLAYSVAVIIQKLGGKIKVPKKTLVPTLAVLLLVALIVCTVIFTGNVIFLIFLIFVAYLLGISIQKLDARFGNHAVISLILSVLFVYAFSVQFSEIEFYRGVWYKYFDYFFKGEGVHILLLNMAVNYFAWLGILIVFGFIGFVVILFKARKNFNEWFILLTILFLTPLFALGTYTIVFLLPIFSLLIGMGLYRIINMEVLKKYAILTIITSLLISASFSCLMIRYWEDEGISHGDLAKTFVTKDETYSAAMFLREYGCGSFISPEDRISWRISCYSKLPIFSGRSAWPLAYSFVDDVEIMGLTEFTLNMDYLYGVNNTVQKNYNILLSLDCDNATAKEILSKYNIHYYIENNNMQPQNQFFKSVREKRYKIYDDGMESIWYLGSMY